jgi:regulator of replication initiation timing
MDNNMPSTSSVDTLSVRLGVLHEDVSEIKTALGKLSEAITKLALVEERQMQTSATLERITTTLTGLDKRIDMLEMVQPKNTETARWVDRGVTAIVVLALSYTVKSILNI